MPQTRLRVRQQVQDEIYQTPKKMIAQVTATAAKGNGKAKAKGRGKKCVEKTIDEGVSGVR